MTVETDGPDFRTRLVSLFARIPEHGAFGQMRRLTALRGRLTGKIVWVHDETVAREDRARRIEAVDFRPGEV